MNKFSSDSECIGEAKRQQFIHRLTMKLNDDLSSLHNDNQTDIDDKIVFYREVLMNQILNKFLVFQINKYIELAQKEDDDTITWTSSSDLESNDDSEMVEQPKKRKNEDSHRNTNKRYRENDMSDD